MADPLSDEPTAHVPPTPVPGSGRVMSIDVLRGFDMFWIIGGHGIVLSIVALLVDPIPDWLGYQMSHPDWIGFSAWDMIMPLFLFIVGAAMPFSFAKRLQRGDSKRQIYRKIVTRSLVLFVLGMVAQGNLLQLNLSTLHVFCNTLQAIACGYLVSAVLLLHVPTVGQILITSGLLLGYWGTMIWIPIPGQGAGHLEPDLNLALYIDHLILGRFDDGTTYTWILSSLGFVATVMLGVFAGKLLRTGISAWMKVVWLVLMGLGCLGAGWVWGLSFPIIKHLWTSSMVLWAGGWSFLLLALFYAVIDVIGWRRWALPLVVIGSNAIAVYMAAHLIDFHVVSDPLIGGLLTHLEPAQEAVRHLAALAVIWLILLYMYRNKTFLRV